MKLKTFKDQRRMNILNAKAFKKMELDILKAKSLKQVTPRTANREQYPSGRLRANDIR